jgi:hypothetical protein
LCFIFLDFRAGGRQSFHAGIFPAEPQKPTKRKGITMPPEQQIDPTQQLSSGTGAVIGIIYLAFVILIIVSMWKVFTKAGEPGWAAIVPIYNAIVFLKIAGKPGWWFILLIIPIVGLVVMILALVSFAERFGKGAGFVIGLLLLPFIFFPILAFGDAQYLGPKAGGALGEPALS